MSVMADSCVPEPDPDYAKAQIRLAREADLAEIDRAAAGWRAGAQRLRDVATRLYGPDGTQWSESWTGRASGEASAGFQVVAERMTQQADVMDAVATELDQARSVLDAAGHEAKRMDDDGLGEKVKHLFGGGEDDSKIAKQAYMAMVGGLAGPAAHFDQTCSSGGLDERDLDKTFASSSVGVHQSAGASASPTSSAAVSRDPITGIPHSSSVDSSTWAPVASSSPLGSDQSQFGSLAPTHDGIPGSGALAGTAAAGAAGVAAIGGAALLARSRGAFAGASGGTASFSGGSSSGSGVIGGSRAGVGTGSGTGSGSALGGAGTTAPTTAVAGGAARAGPPGGNHMLGGMGGQGAGGGQGGSSGSGPRYGQAPQLSDRGRRRKRGERGAVLAAGSREDGNEAAPVDEDDPFYDSE